MRLLLASLNDVSSLAAGFAARGCEVATLQPRFADLGDFGQVRGRPSADASVRTHLSRVWPHRPYPYSLWVTNLRRLLREFQPDVIYYIGEPSELGAAQVARVCDRVGAPVLRRTRASGTDAPTRLALYSFENVDRQWRGFPKSLRGRAERSVLATADLILCASTSAVERLARLGFLRERTGVVPLPADGEVFHPDQPGLPELRQELGVGADDFLVGYVGRLVYEKGVDLLLAALAELPERFRLIIAGGGRYEPELRALTEKLGIAERVRFVGRVARDRLPRYMAALDALALPSRSIPDWQEQFGLVLPEAMLSGVPVIGSDSGAIPEVIGETGLVFPEGDVKGLAESLRRLAEDEALRERLAREGRERALREFGEERYISLQATALQDLASA